MRAAVLGRQSVTLVHRERPEPKPGWVRLAVGAVGICGTDLHLFHGHLGKVDGLQPGHEVAGVVDAVGDDVHLAAGTQVALEPMVTCGHCPHCRSGHRNRCAQVRLFGVAAKGGMAEFLVVPAACLHEVPPTVSANVAALAEPMAVCVRGIRLGGIGVGDRVAILGAGSIGLLSIPAARAAGAAEILVSARHPHQAELARSLGADAVFDSADALLAEGGAADVVVETVGGRAETLADAVRLARSGGRIVVLGLFEGTAGIPGLPFFQKELVIAASNCYAHDRRVSDFELAVKLVTQQAASLAPVVTHRFKLDQVADAYAAAADKSSRSIKVQVEP